MSITAHLFLDAELLKAFGQLLSKVDTGVALSKPMEKVSIEHIARPADKSNHLLYIVEDERDHLPLVNVVYGDAEE